MSKNRIAVNEVSSLTKVKPDYAAIVINQAKALGIPVPQREFVFCDGRKWAADLAYPQHMLLIEIEGGIWSDGRHTRGKGYHNDCIKYNAAALLGYTVLRFTPGMIQHGNRAVTTAIDTIMAYLASKSLAIAFTVRDMHINKRLQKIEVKL